MSMPTLKSRYDVIVAGARPAGAATAMLLARQGLRVLVVDPARRGSDTLSTHALMRAGVLQLHRWGLLSRIRAAGTPKIQTSVFRYGSEAVEVAIKPRDGVDALYAPRRTLLDETLAVAAEGAGACVVHGVSVEDLVRDDQGRVRGAYLAARDRTVVRVEADLVVGADGRRSTVARAAGAEVTHLAPHASANLFGYWPGMELDGYHWYFREGISAGAIPTNDGDTCVFVGFSPERFHADRRKGLDWMYHRALASAFPDLAGLLPRGGKVKLRGFAGAPGVLRRAWGPGWALVGDAGYFRDPITAHGITDALRDAELLARAVAAGSEAGFEEYEATRDLLSQEMIEITDRLASLEWTLDEAKALHMRLSRAMSVEAEWLGALDTGTKPPSGASAPFLRTA